MLHYLTVKTHWGSSRITRSLPSYPTRNSLGLQSWFICLDCLHIWSMFLLVLTPNLYSTIKWCTVIEAIHIGYFHFFLFLCHSPPLVTAVFTCGEAYRSTGAFDSVVVCFSQNLKISKNPHIPLQSWWQNPKKVDYLENLASRKNWLHGKVDFTEKLTPLG